MGFGQLGMSTPGRVEGVEDKDANRNLDDESNDEKEANTGMSERGNRGRFHVIVAGILADGNQNADKSRNDCEEAKDLDRPMESKKILTVRKESDDEGSSREDEQERNGHHQT